MSRPVDVCVTQLALLSALGFLGCADHREVALGDAVVQVDLSACYGAGTNCDGFNLVPRELETPEERTCELDPALSGTIGWTVHPRYEAFAAVAGPSDSLWVAGSGSLDQEPTRIVVERFDTTGAQQWIADVSVLRAHDYWLLRAMSIAVDASGHAFVAIECDVSDRDRGWAMETETWLVELDASGERVGDPIEIEDASDLTIAAAEDGDLLLRAVTGEQPSVLSRLSADRTMPFIQTGIRQVQVHQLLADDEGGALVFGKSAAATAFEWEDSLSLYDARANLVWDVLPGTQGGGMVRDPMGNVILRGGRPEVERFGPYTDIIVNKLSIAGETLWSLRLTDSVMNMANPGEAPATDAEGNVYLTGYDNDPGPLTLYRIDADGRRCTKAHLPELDGQLLQTTGLLFAPGGALFLRGWNEAGRSLIVGQLAR